ncbi:hypothetical protein [Georgenia sp. SYP-B2076]|uniref:hypothetical protein n=1 Tax=Georgenia sp. SYP-B2076 TaxID=2495881 RepID=UPI000F8E71E6|nr:hypothetical protein [Georgenia sp. SYP-B2076]
MRETPLPSTKALVEMLHGMLGRDVAATGSIDPLTPATPGGVVVGVYTSTGLRTAALVALDMPLAARAAAALALMPPRTAEAAIENQYLSEPLTENVAEILNVTASLLNADDAPHVRLFRVHGPQELLPADVAGWLRGYGSRVDTGVTIRGYGDGGISVVVL